MQLAEIAEVTAGGGAPQNKNAFTAEGVPFIRAGSLSSLVSGKSENALEHLTDEVAKEYGLRKFPQDTVVFAKSGMSATKKRVYRLRKEAYIVNHLAAIIPSQCIVPEFLEHFLCVFPPARLIRDPAYPSIRLSDIGTIKIPLPSLEEQKRIAELLDKADELRRQRRQAIETLDSLTQSIFLDLFGDPVTNPKKWRSVNLAEIANIVSGVTKGKKFGDKQTVHVPYMRVANVQDGTIRLDDVAEIEVLPRDIDRYRLLKGDILLTEGGDPDKLGRGAVWDGSIDPCIHQNHIFRVRILPSAGIPEYVSSVIASPLCKRYFFRCAKQTTGIASINMTQLKGCPILLPPRELQEEFTKRCAAIEAQRTKLLAAQKETENLFLSLQQKAFAQ